MKGFPGMDSFKQIEIDRKSTLARHQASLDTGKIDAAKHFRLVCLTHQAHDNLTVELTLARRGRASDRARKVARHL
jgi:hypothetical protein